MLLFFLEILSEIFLLPGNLHFFLALPKGAKQISELGGCPWEIFFNNAKCSNLGHSFVFLRPLGGCGPHAPRLEATYDMYMQGIFVDCSLFFLIFLQPRIEH